MSATAKNGHAQTDRRRFAGRSKPKCLSHVEHMPVFNTKRFKPTAATAEGQLEAGGRQEAFRQMEEKGLRPITLAEKAGGGPAKNGARRTGAWAKFQLSIQKSHAANAGKFHAAAFQPAGGGRAVEPRAGDPLQGSLQSRRAAAKWKEDSRFGGGRHVAGRFDGATCRRPFRAFMSRWCQAGETGGFLDVVLAQIADFQAREKELKSQGDGGACSIRPFCLCWPSAC